MKRTFILFVFFTSILLSSCGKQEDKILKTEDNITKTERNTMKTEGNTTKENATETESMNKVEILNNGKLPSDKEIKSIAIRDGNTGEIIFEEKENEIVNNIAQKLLEIEFIEYEDPQSTGWCYNLLINNDDMQITISGNDLIRIRYGNKSICCSFFWYTINYLYKE